FDLLSPIGGEAYFGRVTIQWSRAEDIFTHNVTYTVSYSADNGSSWVNLATNLTNTTFVWDSTTVEDGEQYLIRVNASCSEGSWHTVTSNDTFTIDNVPPSKTSSTTPSPSSTDSDTPLNLLPLIQVIGLGSIFVFVVSLVIIIRKRQLG
ncbi:MAG: fibronectin type III domain-containing protein, partial [Promethearchaeota archaeon]